MNTTTTYVRPRILTQRTDGATRSRRALGDITNIPTRPRPAQQTVREDPYDNISNKENE